MTEEKKNIEKLKIELIKDLTYLRNKTGFGSYEDDEEEIDIDDSVLQTVSDDKAEIEELNSLKNDLWDNYSMLYFELINDLIDDLVNNFADVDEYHKKFTLLIRRHKNILETEDKIPYSDYLSSLKELFDDADQLYNDLRGEERLLKKKGRKEFFLRIYPTYVTLFSVPYGIVFWAIYYLQRAKAVMIIFGGISGWIIGLIACYFFYKMAFY